MAQRAGVIRALSSDSRGRAYRLPGLPRLLENECLSSWLRRCAAKYRFNSTGEFVAGLLALDDLQLEPGHWDWDRAPPLALLQALERRTGLSLAMLTDRLSSEASLRPGEKDAYCPQCFAEDLQHGEPYMRREWLDPWVVACGRHNCALGCWAAAVGHSNASPAQLLWQELLPVGRVYPIPDRAPRWSAVPAGSKDALYLDEEWQRRLMLFLGLPCGKQLLYALTGNDDVVWLTDTADVGDQRFIRYPKGKIRWRLMAARAALSLGAMSTPRVLALRDPDQLVAALLKDLAFVQRSQLSAAARKSASRGRR